MHGKEEIKMSDHRWRDHLCRKSERIEKKKKNCPATNKQL